MKKTFMIALAGLMLFAFTQCGNDSKDSKKDGESTETQVSGSKEYQTNIKYFDKATQILNNAKDCEKLKEDLSKAEKMFDKEFDEKDQMTDEEKAKIEIKAKELIELMFKTTEKLGCN